jgi:hypothetical protein
MSRNKEVQDRIDDIIETLIGVALKSFQAKRTIAKLEDKNKEALLNLSFESFREIEAEIQDLESDMRANDIIIRNQIKEYKQLQKEYPGENLPPLPDDIDI